MLYIVFLFIGIFIGYEFHVIENRNLAMQYFVKGNEYYDKKNFFKAAEMANRSLGLEPHWKLSFTLLSTSYRKMDESIAHPK